MSGIVTVREGKHTNYLFPVAMRNGSADAAYLNATDVIKEAIRKDRKKHYEAENGPNFAIEVQRALDYSFYVGDYATTENLHKFNTSKGYTFFVDTAARKG